MSGVQVIRVDGELAGMVVEDQFVIRDGLQAAQVRTAQAMALFAIEIEAGERPGPYTQERAVAFAHQLQIGSALRALD